MINIIPQAEPADCREEFWLKKKAFSTIDFESAKADMGYKNERRNHE